MKKIVAICGSGLGSSFLVEMNIKQVLKDMGVTGVEVDHTDLGSAWAGIADLIVCGEDLESNCKRFGTTISLNNIIDKNELKEKLSAYFTDNDLIK